MNELENMKNDIKAHVRCIQSMKGLDQTVSILQGD